MEGAVTVNAMIQRLITGAVTAGIVTLALRLVSATAAPLILVWIGVLLAVLTAGTTSAVLAEWAAGRLLSGRRAGPWKRYGVHTLIFAASGFLVCWLLQIGLFGQPPFGRATAAQAAAAGIPAMIVYCSVWLALRAAMVRVYRAKYGKPVETARLMLWPCTVERYEQAEAEQYPMGDHVKTYIEMLRRYPGLLGWGVWLARLKETGELVGDIGFKGNPDFGGAVDIGYGFLPEHRGKGYATEATNALVAWAFRNGAGRVTAETLRDNYASIRVLRKSGFSLYREDEHFYWRIDAERVYK